MKKIKVGDLREYGKEILSEDIVLNIGKMEVGVKQHTSIMDKVDFAARVYNDSITTENETHLISSLMFNVSYKTTLIKRYTNLTLPEDGIEAYDLITNTGLYDFVYSNISDIETEELERVIEDYIANKQEKYEQEYSIGYVAKRLVSTIADMIPDAEELGAIMNSVQSLASNLDDGKLSEITNELQQKVGE